MEEDFLNKKFKIVVELDNGTVLTYRQCEVKDLKEKSIKFINSRDQKLMFFSDVKLQVVEE